MKVLIIGGVAGGAGTAARLRRNDEHAEIILFEKDGYISYANCGMPYYIGGEIEDREALLLQTPERFWERFRVEVRIGHEVVAINAGAKSITVQNQDKQYMETYDKLVLSPGTAPIIPSISGIDKGNVFTVKSLTDTYRLHDFIQQKKPRHCAVIGGGFIGLEMTENLARLGIQVSVIEADSHVMPSLDWDMAQELHHVMQENGVALYLNRKCQSIYQGFVVLDDDTRVQAEFAVVCAGVRPQTRFLEHSGIVLGMRGEICVDGHMETSAKDIYALGDAVSVENIVGGQREMVPLASPAARQARTVAGEITGKRQAYQGTQGTSVLRLFSRTAAGTGMNEEKLKKSGIPYRKSYTYSGSHAGYYPGADMMSLKLLFSPEDGRVLGAQIVGGDGVDKRIDVLSCAVRGKWDIYHLQDLELAYAPPFSSSKDPVNIAGYVAGNMMEGSMIPFYAEDLDCLPGDCQRIDVRTREEYENGSIEGFRNMPLDTLREHLDELDRERPVYITCQIGLRGYLAQRILMQHGYETYNLSGGYRFYQCLNRKG